MAKTKITTVEMNKKVVDIIKGIIVDVNNNKESISLRLGDFWSGTDKPDVRKEIDMLLEKHNKTNFQSIDFCVRVIDCKLCNENLDNPYNMVEMTFGLVYKRTGEVLGVIKEKSKVLCPNVKSQFGIDVLKEIVKAYDNPQEYIETSKSYTYDKFVDMFVYKLNSDSHYKLIELFKTSVLKVKKTEDKEVSEELDGQMESIINLNTLKELNKLVASGAVKGKLKIKFSIEGDLDIDLDLSGSTEIVKSK